MFDYLNKSNMLTGSAKEFNANLKATNHPRTQINSVQTTNKPIITI